jgi:hypothetical protein
MNAGVRLFVGGHGSAIRGQPFDLDGDRMFSPCHPAGRWPVTAAHVTGIIDSGAFTDPPHKRLMPDLALDRQLAWERHASDMWDADWQAFGLVSYDLLIDETWIAGGQRVKRRWSVQEAERAVIATIEAAAYLSSQRETVAPRILILCAQGVDADQYTECAQEILKVATPVDWFGFGGWCIVGRFTSLLPTFWQTITAVLPLVAAAGLKHVHVFGVLYLPALGGLLWLCDSHGLTLSTDSTAPVLACTRRDAKKAGVRADGWRENVSWWLDHCATLHQSRYYRQPPDAALHRQLELFELEAS